MNELITINFEEQTISARELYEKLSQDGGLKGTERFSKWFERFCSYGFEEGIDYSTPHKKVRVQLEGTREVQREVEDYELSMEMAKQICMLQRTEIGKQIRQYLIKVEDAWNTPEAVMARALQMSNKLIDSLKADNRILIEENERMKPKEIFADAVSASDTSILIRDLAKILKQNGVPTGEKRLYRWMREHGFIIKGSTRPTQKAMERGLFEIIESTVQRSDLPPITTMTTKVTGKGQQYFINLFLAERKKEVI